MDSLIVPVHLFLQKPIKSTGTLIGDAICLQRTNPNSMIELTGAQRNQILKAITKGER